MSTMTDIIVHNPADFHVHLRQGHLSKIVTPDVRRGGFNMAYVMVPRIHLICALHSVHDAPDSIA